MLEVNKWKTSVKLLGRLTWLKSSLRRDPNKWEWPCHKPDRDKPCSQQSGQNSDTSELTQPEGDNSASQGSQPRVLTLNRQHQWETAKKETKAAIMVSCLIINSFSSAEAGDGIHNSKWGHMNQLLCTSRTGILIVSEAHLTERCCDKLEKLFVRRMKNQLYSQPRQPNR